MRKKGFLLAEETLKIILGVIAIGFLAFLLFSLYSHARDAKELDLAKESLNFLMSEIQAGKTSVEVYNPEGWNIIYWPHLVESSFAKYLPSYSPPQQNQKPQTCDNLGWGECICICPKNDKTSCDDKGFCVNNPEKWQVSGDGIELKDLPLTLNIDLDKKEISA